MRPPRAPLRERTLNFFSKFYTRIWFAFHTKTFSKNVEPFFLEGTIKDRRQQPYFWGSYVGTYGLHISFSRFVKIWCSLRHFREIHSNFLKESSSVGNRNNPEKMYCFEIFPKCKFHRLKSVCPSVLTSLLH